MVRKIIEINEELCDGCGICANACHEGAIAIVDGKARLIRDDYCDGLGNCLPACPKGAISFVEREALPFNEEEVMKAMLERNAQKNEDKNNAAHHVFSGGCPGTRLQQIRREGSCQNVSVNEGSRQDVSVNEDSRQDVSRNDDNRREEGKREDNRREDGESKVRRDVQSQLGQWPVQIQLVPVNAPYFNGADLLIAADCTAYAYGDFHSFMRNKITLIGCPKLDDADYAEKLANILAANDIRSITVIRMEVPCCGGIVHAVQTAMKGSGKIIPWRIITISIDGSVIE